MALPGVIMMLLVSGIFRVGAVSPILLPTPASPQGFGPFAHLNPTPTPTPERTPVIEYNTAHGIPSVYVGPGGVWVVTGGNAPPSAPLQGSAISFEQGSSGDIYVYLSDSLKSTISTAITENCLDQEDEVDCERLVSGLLQNAAVELQPRFLQAIPALPAIVAAVGEISEAATYIFTAVSSAYVAWALAHQNKPIPAIVKIPQSDIAKISSVITASPSSMIIDDNGRKTIINIAPTQTFALGARPTLSKLTSPTGGHSIGDYLLTMPTDLASRTDTLIRKVNLCHGTDVDIKCVVAAAQNVALQSQSRGPIHDLALYKGSFPGFGLSNTLAAVKDVSDFAMQLAPQLGLLTYAAREFGELVFTLAYTVLIQDTPLGTENYFAASELASGKITAAPATSTSSGCPTLFPIICQTSSCSGNAEERTCRAPDLIGCRCTNIDTFPPPDYYDTALGNAQVAAIKSYDESGIAKATPNCYLQTVTTLFNGDPGGSPTAYCGCTQTANKIASRSYTLGIYPTFPGRSGQSKCAYTSLPSQMLSLSLNDPKTTSIFVTSCRSITVTLPPSTISGTPWPTVISSCTCNDNWGWPFYTTTSGSSTISYCPDKTPTFSSSSSPAPTIVAKVIISYVTWSHSSGFLVSAASGSYYDVWNEPLVSPNLCSRSGSVQTSLLPSETPDSSTFPIGSAGDCTYWDVTSNPLDGGFLKCSAFPQIITCKGIPRWPPLPPSIYPQASTNGTVCQKNFQDLTGSETVLPVAQCNIMSNVLGQLEIGKQS